MSADTTAVYVGAIVFVSPYGSDSKAGVRLITYEAPTLLTAAPCSRVGAAEVERVLGEMSATAEAQFLASAGVELLPVAVSGMCRRLPGHKGQHLFAFFIDDRMYAAEWGPGESGAQSTPDRR